MMTHLLSERARVTSVPVVAGMTHKRHRELWNERIKELIRSTPSGQPIGVMKFHRATDSSIYSNTWRRIELLVKHGEIFRAKNEHGKYYYWLDESRVIKPASKPDIKPQGLSISDIETKAKDWAWKHQSNDLRAFIDDLAKHMP